MSENPESPAAHLLDSLDGFRVEVDEAGERADVVLDRPPLNVVSMRQRTQLGLVFDRLDRDSRVRVIVLRGSGAHFSSGGDIPGFLAASPDELAELAWNVAAPERCHKPVIAAVRGYCFGVGFELALACDLRVVARSAELALPEMRLGMIPGSGGSARLVRMIGIGRAKDMVMRARRISGEQAYAWGIATSLVEDDALEGAVASLVDELRAFSPLAQRTLKRVMNAAQEAPLHVAIDNEGEAYGRLRGSEDYREGVEAFGAKRKPVFKGR